MLRLEPPQYLRTVVVFLARPITPQAPKSSRPGLFRSGGARTATVGLLAPNTYFDHRTTRLDLRMGKSVRLTQRVKVQGNVDLYNVTNSGSVLADTNAYGARWLVPTLVLEPRILQFSANLTF